MKQEKLDRFRDDVMQAAEESCRLLYRNNRERLNIKKEELAIRNYILLTNTALKLCREKGFQAMSIRDLSRESGLSLGALYYYFSSKDEIIRFIHEQGHHFMQEFIMKRIAGIDDPREKLHKTIETHIMLSEVGSDWFFFFFMETKNVPLEMRSIPLLSEIWFENLYSDIIKEGKKKGIFVCDNIDFVSSAIKSLLQDWYLKRWRFSQKKMTVEKYINSVIALIEAYIIPAK